MGEQNYRQRPQAPEMAQEMLKNINLECALLNVMMQNQINLSEAMEQLQEEYFYFLHTRSVFKTIRNLFRAGTTRLSETLVMDELQRSFKEPAAALPIMCTVMQNSSVADEELDPSTLVARVCDLGQRRQLLDVVRQLKELGYSTCTPLGEGISQAQQALTTILSGGQQPVLTLSQGFDDLLGIMDDNLNPATSHLGVMCGIPMLDQAFGLIPGFSVIAAETSHGKTSLACYMGARAMMSGAQVAFYSLEMSKDELTARIVATQSGVPASRILYRGLTTQERSRVETAMAELRRQGADNFYFDRRMSTTVTQVCNSITALHNRYGLKLVIIDYLQLLGLDNDQPRSETQEHVLSEACRRFFLLGKRLGVSIWGLSQLNRNGTGEPDLTRVRDSGMITAVADMVLIVYRAALKQMSYPKPLDGVTTENTAELYLAKNRGGAIGRSIMGFLPETTTFVPLDQAALPREGEAISGGQLELWEAPHGLR